MMLRCYAPIVASVALIIFTDFTEVAAYPYAPGSCAAGSAALQDSHLYNSQVGTGPLADAGFKVRINGNALEEGTAFDVPIGDAHTIKLVATASASYFRGFLIRLAGDGVDTTEALIVPSEVDDVQVLSLCVDYEGVGGISHNSKSAKSSIRAKLQLTEPNDGLTMDVIVVVSNDSGESEWYHSAFTINAVDSSSTGTEAPSVSPLVNTTDVPGTSSPTTGASEASDTSAPTSGSTEALNTTSAPTSATTEAPSTSAPTSGTTAAPTSGTTSAPTSGTTGDTAAPTSGTTGDTTAPTPAPTPSGTAGDTSAPTFVMTEAPGTTIAPTSDTTKGATSAPTSDVTGDTTSTPVGATTEGPTAMPTATETTSGVTSLARNNLIAAAGLIVGCLL